MHWRSNIAVIVAMMVPVAAQAMTVGEFVAKAHGLQAMGALAVTSPDLPLVTGEIKTAAAAYRAEIDTAQRSGQQPRSCPPPRGQAKVDSKTIMTAFEAIPPAKRGMSVKAAFYSFMDRRYRCARVTP